MMAKIITSMDVENHSSPSPGTPLHQGSIKICGISALSLGSSLLILDITLFVSSSKFGKNSSIHRSNRIFGSPPAVASDNSVNIGPHCSSLICATSSGETGPKNVINQLIISSSGSIPASLSSSKSGFSV